MFAYRHFITSPLSVAFSRLSIQEVLFTTFICVYFLLHSCYVDWDGWVHPPGKPQKLGGCNYYGLLS